MTASAPLTPLLGVDVGGTSVKLGILVGDVPAGERTVPVAGVATVETVLDGVVEALRELAGDAPIEGVGVGMPGLIDRAAGVALDSPNLPIFNGCDLRAGLAARLGLGRDRVVLENDANVAALGEARLGAARGVANALMVTLGTGVGGGLILGGELVVGEGLAGEIGHVVVEPDGEPCGCGGRGCLETLASATAARRRARAAGLTEDLVELAERARASDGPERALLDHIGHDLGRGLAAAVSLVDVRTFVFGGGFSGALDRLLPGIRRGLQEWAYGARMGELQLVRAALGPAAGWIGAACLPRPGVPRAL